MREKKMKWFLWGLAVFMLTIWGLPNIGGLDNNTVVTAEAATKVALSKASLSLGVGSTHKLQLTGVTKGEKVTWKSSNTKVLTATPLESDTRYCTLKGVKAGTAKVAATYGGKTYTCTVKVPVTPGKVALKKISSPAYNKIKITWKKATNATSYVVYYKKYGASKWTKLAVVGSTTTSYTHKSSTEFPIVVGQKYSYTVRAYSNKAKKYGTYNKTGLTTKTVPSKPTLKSAALNSSKTAVTVSWGKSRGNGYYRIYRKTSSSSKWVRIASVKSSVLSYTDKNPVQGEVNTYTVRALKKTTKALSKCDTTGVSVTVPKADVKVTSVSLNKTSASLTAKGQTVQLSATIAPANATNKAVTWTSSNAKAATVDSTGKVTAVADGTATITATAKDGTKKSATCKVTVKIPVLVSSITLNKTSVTLTAKGQTAQLTAAVAPSNATNKELTWKSDNPSVATVDSTGKVTAISNGTTVIWVSAKAKYGSCMAGCKVTVNIPAPTATETVKVSSITLDTPSYHFSEKEQTYTLKATVSPANATNKNITWASSNTNVATVDNSGKITAIGKGTCTITATAADGSGKSASCKITAEIHEITTAVTLNHTTLELIEKGQTVQLSATMSPLTTTNKTVNWSTSNKDIATVDSNGKVTAVGDGTAFITAVTADESGFATCYVTVSLPIPNPYTYQLIPMGEAYSNDGVFGVYIKTDNPDPGTLHFEFNGITYTTKFDDIHYLEKPGEVVSSFRKVAGGYFFAARLTTPGTQKMTLYWYPGRYLSGGFGKHQKIAELTVNVKDSEKEERAWAETVLKEVTNNDMSNQEKMEALRKYVFDNFKYAYNSGNDIIALFSEHSKPYWIGKHIDCLDATYIMQYFANLLGLKSESTYAGYKNHHYATVYFEDGSKYGFDACPYSPTGYITNWDYIL